MEKDQKYIKNAVMVTVLIIWALYMITYLFRTTDPDPILWGLPSGVWVLLNPPSVKIFKKADDKTTSNTEAE